MTSVKFRCVRSGNVITMHTDADIADLRKRESYVEVTDEPSRKDATDEAPRRTKREKKTEIPDFMRG